MATGGICSLLTKIRLIFISSEAYDSDIDSLFEQNSYYYTKQEDQEHTL